MGSTHSVIKLLKERFSRSGGTLSFDVLIRDLILLQDESLLRIVRSFWIQSPPESQTRLRRSDVDVDDRPDLYPSAIL
jgi:hypothetical protein